MDLARSSTKAGSSPSALGAVGDEGGGEGGTAPAVLAVDVLNDFLTTFVLKVHVDIRRLVPFPGDKPLE